MARRRHQAPKPKRRGAWWTLLVWKDQVVKGQRTRKRERVELGPASLPVREAQRLADEYLRPINQGLESIGSAVNFRTPEQFQKLLAEIPEPYATMIYVAVYTALRVSELIALRWCCLGEDSITIVERCSRGDWGEPKSESSNATIGVDPSVIARMQALKSMTIKVKAGHATRRYKAVKADGPNDLVFQSVQDGKPMRDNNILVRYIKPAGRKIGLPFVNWLCLRRSYATWMVESGANPKDVQAQMRHSKIGPTMDIYAQFVPESQRRAVNKMMAMVKARQTARPAAMPGLASTMVQ